MRKINKSKKERRKLKFEGSVERRQVEELSLPEGPLNMTIPEDIVELQKKDPTLQDWFQKVSEVDGVRWGCLLFNGRKVHHYICYTATVISDYATKYPEAFPLRKIKARQEANCLVQLFYSVGVPRDFFTDQGTNSISLQLKQVYQLLRIKAIKTTPYHPQNDGLVGHFNQTLKSMLQKFVSKSRSDWDQ